VEGGKGGGREEGSGGESGGVGEGDAAVGEEEVEEVHRYMGTPTVDMWLGSAAQGNARLLGAMLSAHPEVRGWLDERGRSALHLAALCPQGAASVDLLIAAGANARSAKRALYHPKRALYHPKSDLLMLAHRCWC